MRRYTTDCEDEHLGSGESTSVKTVIARGGMSAIDTGHRALDEQRSPPAMAVQQQTRERDTAH